MPGGSDGRPSLISVLPVYSSNQREREKKKLGSETTRSTLETELNDISLGALSSAPALIFLSLPSLIYVFAPIFV